MTKRLLEFLFMVAAATAVGCGQDSASGDDAASGRLALASAAADGVAGFQFDVRRGDNGMLVTSRFVASGPTASTFFALAATPMSSPETRAPGCSFAIADATIVAGQTTEVMMVVPCEGVGRGGLDISARTDPAPTITGLSFDPPTAVGPCEPRRIVVEASDPTNEPIDYFLGAGGGPPAAAITIAAFGDGSFDFSASLPGSYSLDVRACDPHFGCPTLAFGLEVREAAPGSNACGPPP
jgi:hypothetical protein